MGVELDGALSVEIGGTPHGCLVSSETEHRKWDRNRKIDSNLSCLNLVLEFSSVSSGLGENSHTVSKLVFVDQLDGFVQSVDSDDDHDGGEELVVVASHAGFGVINDGGADPVASWESFDVNLSSVKDDFAALSFSGSKMLVELLKSSGVVQRSDIGVLVTTANLESLGLFQDLRDPVL